MSVGAAQGIVMQLIAQGGDSYTDRGAQDHFFREAGKVGSLYLQGAMDTDGRYQLDLAKLTEASGGSFRPDDLRRTTTDLYGSGTRSLKDLTGYNTMARQQKDPTLSRTDSKYLCSRC
ncbi:MAG: hypothetical protein ABIH82_01190 [Candidatus Woesearchaeota archaeon]